jgi:hypothetical protein
MGIMVVALSGSIVSGSPLSVPPHDESCGYALKKPDKSGLLDNLLQQVW